MHSYPTSIGTQMNTWSVGAFLDPSDHRLDRSGLRALATVSALLKQGGVKQGARSREQENRWYCLGGIFAGGNLDAVTSCI